MEKFVVQSGTAMPLRRVEVDTDQIAPARFVPYYRPGGFANMLFADWRADPSFVLNRPEYQGASILVAGRDFGIGSSRESAVWALRDAGFRALIAPSFADIFRGNCLARGLVAAAVPTEFVERLWDLLEADPWTVVTVDLQRLQVHAPDLVADFTMETAPRQRIMSGADLIAQTLGHAARIAEHEQARRPGLPTTTSLRVAAPFSLMPRTAAPPSVRPCPVAPAPTDPAPAAHQPVGFVEPEKGEF